MTIVIMRSDAIYFYVSNSTHNWQPKKLEDTTLIVLFKDSNERWITGTKYGYKNTCGQAHNQSNRIWNLWNNIQIKFIFQ